MRLSGLIHARLFERKQHRRLGGTDDYKVELNSGQIEAASVERDKDTVFTVEFRRFKLHYFIP